MVKWLVAIAVLSAGASSLSARSEAELKQYFEGRTVFPKLAMPGSQDGVDIYPGTDRTLDYSKYGDRLKEYGTALRAGEPVIVTRIKLKSKLIEFQLGGGGYGRERDISLGSPGVGEPSTSGRVPPERDVASRCRCRPGSSICRQ